MARHVSHDDKLEEDYPTAAVPTTAIVDDEGVLRPAPTSEGEVEVPYSIYTTKEKWLIVAMVALAGFYR